MQATFTIKICMEEDFLDKIVAQHAYKELF